jgi:hypothetical protein
MADLISMLAATAGTSTGGINPREYFNTVLYTGTLSTPNAISGVGFAPDFIWFKSRTQAYNNYLFNKITSGSNFLYSNGPNAEGTTGDSISFDSDGFTITAGSALNDSFGSPNNMVAWNWKANGAGVSNTDGTITGTVTVSANTTAGISIVTYTGNATQGATVGHGLGVTPSMLIVKSRSLATDWVVQHSSAGTAPSKLIVNSTGAVTNSAPEWNNAGGTPTAFNSTVFTIAGSGYSVNNSGATYVAYCFAEVEGFSKFGSYTGNGSATGPSVTTDFEPTWLMIKRTDTTSDWIILDSARDTANPRDKFLEPNTADAEATGNDVDFNATGFQLKSTSASTNDTGGTYIYACFA